jgi:hypothetical protein
MRSGLLPASVAVAVVAALAFGGCTDDGATPDGTGVPGVNDAGVDDPGVNDDGYLSTSLPAITEPQFTAAPNPDAGRDGAPSPEDPGPVTVSP